MSQGSSGVSEPSTDYVYTDADESNLTTILTADSPRVSQPDNINLELKQHQLAMIYKCDMVERTCQIPFKVTSKKDPRFKYDVKTKVGIIGDVVGSGKTFTVLGLIDKFRNSIPKYNSIDFFEHHNETKSNNCLVKIKTVASPVIEVVNTTVIIVPHTILTQWKEAILKNVKNLKYAIVNNTKTLTQFKTDLRQGADESDEHLLMSSTFTPRVSDMIYHMFGTYDIYIRRLVIDEGDSIKLPKHGIVNIHPMFTWIVTSTYQSVLNPNGIIKWFNPSNGQLSDYYSYQTGFTFKKRLAGIHYKGFVYNMMSHFSNISQIELNDFRRLFVLKNDNSFVNMAFQLQPPIQHIIECDMPLSLRVLSNVVSNSILNKINAGDLRGALDELECDKVSEKDLINAVTKDLKARLENRMIEYEMNCKMNWTNETTKQQTLAKIKTKITELESKIENIKSKLNDNTACNICFDDITSTALAPCCNTKFCFECITKWLTIQSGQSSCPFCRAKLDLNSLILVDENAHKKNKNMKQLLSKLDMFKSILEQRIKEDSNIKILVFSDYVNTLDNYIPALIDLGISYTHVSGTTATISKKVREFKSNTGTKIDCLLLNAEYCASGLNLENTTDIFITHKMSGSKTHQIIGRGQRPGRVGRLNVWKMYYKTEM